MHTIPNSSAPGRGSNVSAVNHPPSGTSNSAVETETKSERVERFYATQGGPLMPWLLDECRQRGTEMLAMTTALGVTYGYINQLRNGIRKTEDVSHDFCVACARYLGVPTIAIKIVAGVVRMSDFLHPAENEEEAVERAIRHIQDDPVIRQAVPVDLSSLSFEAKKAIALLYVQSSSQDVFGLKELPAIVHWCQRAAVLHDDRTFESMTGHRDSSVR
ncbi:hypothetical protein [Rhodoferax ferrireducens]|uniref:hypothetical protein n=1 Tax=Rhodoferax ferrireducens TaxID=192843 RepID=UPI001300768A|nr:hypothetical protein [Rhodoferax ferrireducens]